MDVARREPDDDRRGGEHRAHDPRAREALVVLRSDDELTEVRTEREAAVDRDRPVAERLAATRLRRAVGDHRRRTDEERRLADARDDAHQHEPPQRADRAVRRGRARDDGRAADEQHAPAATIADDAGHRP